MDVHRSHSLRIRVAGVLSFCGVLLLAGCSTGGDAEKSAAPATTESSATAAPKTPFVPVDACSLLGKEEVEALTGQKVLKPLKEEIANLVTCGYGDPESPQIAPGRSLSQILTVAVFTGEEGAYYAGPVAQAKDTFETGRKNAASPQKVNGLGEDAYWDETFRTLNIYKGKYELSVTVESGKGLNLAKTVAEKALTKLP